MRSVFPCLAACLLLSLSAPALGASAGASTDSMELAGGAEHGEHDAATRTDKAAAHGKAKKSGHAEAKADRKSKADKPHHPALVGGVAFLVLLLVGGGAGFVGALRENL